MKGLIISSIAGFGLIALKRYCNGPMSLYRSANGTDMTGKTVVITGGNTGLGRETALELAKMKAHVILACRDSKKAEKAATELAKESGNPKIEAMILDVSSLSSVREFVREYKQKHSRLDVLINNAGIPDTLPGRAVTSEGYETVFATNHLGPYLLTKELSPLLAASGAGSRVVNLSSGLEAMADLDLDDLQFEKRAYSGVYESSKLCNILWTNELGRRFDEAKNGVLAVSVRPGFVPSTEMSGKTSGGWFYKGIGVPLLWPICKDLSHGVQTSVYCAAAPANKLVQGMTGSSADLHRPFSLCVLTDARFVCMLCVVLCCAVARQVVITLIVLFPNRVTKWVNPLKLPNVCGKSLSRYSTLRPKKPLPARAQRLHRFPNKN